MYLHISMLRCHLWKTRISPIFTLIHSRYFFFGSHVRPKRCRQRTSAPGFHRQKPYSQPGTVYYFSSPLRDFFGTHERTLRITYPSLCVPEMCHNEIKSYIYLYRLFCPVVEGVRSMENSTGFPRQSQTIKQHAGLTWKHVQDLSSFQH